MTLASRPPPDLDEFKELLFRCAREFIVIRDWSLEVHNEYKQLLSSLHEGDRDEQEMFSSPGTMSRDVLPDRSATLTEPHISEAEGISSWISQEQFCPGKEAHDNDDDVSPTPPPQDEDVIQTPQDEEVIQTPLEDVRQVVGPRRGLRDSSQKAAEAVLTNLIAIGNPRDSYTSLRSSRGSWADVGVDSQQIVQPETAQTRRMSQVVQSLRRSMPGPPPGFAVDPIGCRKSKKMDAMTRIPSISTVDTGSASRGAHYTAEDLLEMQQHKELEKWFMQMQPIEGSYLTPPMIQNFLAVAREEHMRSIDWIKGVMLELNEHVEVAMEVPLEAETESETSPHFNMHFPAFCELIQWDTLDGVMKDQMVKRRILEVRAAIIRNSVDVLICKYTHLDMPNQKDFESQKRRWEQALDIIVGCAIVLNAITIGISADHPWAGFQVSELLFTAMFCTEIALKVAAHGCYQQFRGPDQLWNDFDVFIVVLAVFDAIMTYIVRSQNDMANVTIIRMARLARLTRLMRLLRLLRLRIFKELLLMVKGVVAGLRTLFWAIVLLVFVVYVVGVLLRQTVGEDDIHVISGPYNTQLFATVGWSMFNVFRCFTADCNLLDGTPIVGHLYEAYGWKFVFPYALIMLFITFGIFNLIMAIFVENVMESARQKRQLTESAERGRVCRKLRELVLKFGGTMKIQVDRKETSVKSELGKTLNIAISRTRSFLSLGAAESESDAATGSWSKAYGKASDTYVVEAPHFQFGGQISREMFQNVVVQTDASELLEDLEIHISDRSELFDVLDADGSGFLDVSELISGLLKLRSGGADKSDVVAAILGIRSLHKTFSNFMQLALENQRILNEKADCQEQKLDEVARQRARKSQQSMQAKSSDHKVVTVRLNTSTCPEANTEGAHRQKDAMKANEMVCL